VKRIGILYHPKIERARELAYRLKEFLTMEGISSWQCSAWEEDEATPQVTGSELIFSIGGDGTVLHTAHVAAPFEVPILGVNFGKLGFITELGGGELLSRLPEILEGEGWIEERAMLQSQIEDRKFHALNDVVLRTTNVRLISIEIQIDAGVLTTYRADGIIIATATGSTAYSLAAGGPVLHPECGDIVLQPICCHLGLNYTLVLPSQSVITAKVISRDGAILSLDGQLNLPLSCEQSIQIKLSPYIARFLRIRNPDYFYSSLWQKLQGKVA